MIRDCGCEFSNHSLCHNRTTGRGSCIPLIFSKSEDFSLLIKRPTKSRTSLLIVPLGLKMCVWKVDIVKGLWSTDVPRWPGLRTTNLLVQTPVYGWIARHYYTIKFSRKSPSSSLVTLYFFIQLVRATESERLGLERFGRYDSIPQQIWVGKSMFLTCQSCLYPYYISDFLYHESMIRSWSRRPQERRTLRSCSHGASWILPTQSHGVGASACYARKCTQAKIAAIENKRAWQDPSIN